MLGDEAAGESAGSIDDDIELGGRVHGGVLVAKRDHGPPAAEVQTTDFRDGVTYITGGTIEQFPMWARALWFLALGWWIGAIYLGIAWFLLVEVRRPIKPS